MASAWESAVFHPHGLDLAKLATTAHLLTSNIIDPIDVSIHFMSPVASKQLCSCEITSFRSRPALIHKEAAAYLEREIFGCCDLHFKNIEIVLARHLSEMIESGSVYLYGNESYNAAGFVKFLSGTVADFEILGWEGTDTYFSKTNREFKPELRQQLGLVIDRGVSSIGVDLEIEFLDDLFELFYGSDAVCRSFQLVERRAVLPEPREI